METWWVVVVILLLMAVPVLVAVGQAGPGGGAAQKRAERLLKDLLTEDEYGRLNRRRYLDVRSPSRPHRTYRVPRHRGLVQVYEGGVLIAELCVQPVVRIPDGDTVLLHKLMIEGNEAEYLRVANRFAPRPWRRSGSVLARAGAAPERATGDGARQAVRRDGQVNGDRVLFRGQEPSV
jgi:hypothetical protein